MLQHILLDLRKGCPILKFGHIHIFQRELNPNLFRVDLALGKQDNRLDMPWDNSVNKTVSIYADCSSSLVEQFPPSKAVEWADLM